MSNLHENQTKILDHLLDHPEGATLEELSSHLGITKSATKEHIVKLSGHGYISYKDSKGQVGRPKRSYLLTESGQEVFPRQYSWIAIMLLELLAETEGSQKVEKLMDRLAKKVVGSLENRFDQKMNSAERLAVITKILNELGYRSKLKQSDLRKGAVIEATNCVYHTVAKKHPELCHFDTTLIENLAGLPAKLEKCITRGDSICRFCIKK